MKFFKRWLTLSFGYNRSKSTNGKLQSKLKERKRVLNLANGEIIDELKKTARPRA